MRADGAAAAMSGVDYLSFPGANDVFWVETEPGLCLPVYRLAGPAAAPALLFGHANGFSAGSYAPWLKDMARSAQIFAFDARGHGASRWPDGALDKLFHADRFARDLAGIGAAVTARLGGQAPVYVGHSLGAAAALHLETMGGAPRWPRMILFEPQTFPTEHIAGVEIAEASIAPLVEGARRRRADWPDADAFFARLKGRGAFARFSDEMLRAHCHATLKPKPKRDGDGYTLACPPAVEAAIYAAQRAARSWAQLDRVSRPVKLVSGDPSLADRSWISVVIGALARQLPHASLTILAKAGHLMFFEQPNQCAELVRTSLREVD